MKYNFVHLHNHTEYSLLDGMIKIKELVAKTKSFGMEAVAITDHGNMFGAIEFYKECKSAGIKPIIGSEFYMTAGSRYDKSKERYHIILLAKNYEGYKNLIQLSSLAYTQGYYYKPRIDRELLEQYHHNLICLSACIAGEIPSHLLAEEAKIAEEKASYFQRLFGPGSFFLEIQFHKMKEEEKVIKELVKLSVKLKIPLVATNDAHYLEKEDAKTHEVLLCIGTKKTISDEKRMRFPSDEFYFKSEEEMELLFKHLPSSLSNTKAIADQCNIQMDFPGPILPEFEVPENFTKETYLKKLTEEGIYKRYENVTPEIQERMDMELNVITKMGFSGYFLIVWDFIKYARDHGIWVGPGRGSGAGSIVAYALGITNIDPLQYDLLFERFLNIERVSMPDFDIDFCKERRGEVMEYVNKKYGIDRVSQIVTFGKMKAKSVIRDVGRVLEIPLQRVNQIAKLVPEEGKELKDKLELSPELKELAENGTEEEQLLIQMSLKLEGLTRQTGVHACGVVIGKEKITDYVPLQVVKDEKVGDTITTQFPGPQLEECGLVKMDFLGLITLTLIRDCLELLERENIHIDIDKISFEDPKVFEVFAKGDTIAIFQFESPGMQKHLKALQPNKISDIIAMNALYRPGPMKYIENFINRKHGKEKIIYDHPCLESVLDETYGIMVYQEQVMRVSQVMAGYSLGSADILRRAMGKKKQEVMKQQLEIFVKGAIGNHIDQKTAEAVFQNMEEFANYGFNKSHAAAYSYLAYQCAYLKAYYPVHFMAAVLSSEIGNPEKIAEYIKYCHKKGISIIPPDINQSQVKFSVKENSIVYSLNGIKGVGESASKNIVETREKIGKYKDFLHFLQNADLRIVNKSVVETLIKVGAFDSFGQKRRWIFENLEDLLTEAQQHQNDRRAGQMGLFDFHEIKEEKIEGIETEEWEETFKLFEEKNILGFFVSGNPLDKYRSFIKTHCPYDSQSIHSITIKGYNSTRTSLVGIIDTVKISKNESGESWAMVTLSDAVGSFTVFVYKNQFAQYGSLLIPKRIVFLKLFCRKNKDDSLALSVESIEDLNEKRLSEVTEFHVYITPNQIADKNELKLFRSDIDSMAGSLKLFFHIKQENEDELIIKSRDCVAPKDPELSKVFMDKYQFIENIRLL